MAARSALPARAPDLALMLLWLLALAAPAALAHGGVYRGPGSTVPPAGPGAGPTSPGGPAGPSTGGVGGSPAADPNSWRLWWGEQRASALDLKAAIDAADPSSGDDEFYLGRGARPASLAGLRPDAALARQRVLPALLAALAEGAGKDLSTACMIAAAKIGDAPDAAPRVGPTLLPYLADGNQEIAESAALALGILADERNLPLLAGLCADEPGARQVMRAGRAVPTRTRAFALYGMALCAARSPREDVRRFAVARAAALLGRGDPAARDLPVASILALGLVPLQPGDAARLDPSAPVSSGRGAQIARLLVLFEDDLQSPLLRANVPGALANLLVDREPGDPATADARTAVVHALSRQLDPNSKAWRDVQVGCAQALARLGDCDGESSDAELRSALEGALASRDALVRARAEMALAEVAARPGRGGASALEEENRVRRLLLGRLARGSSLSRPWSALALATLESGRARRGLDVHPDSRRALLEALSQAASGDERAAVSLALGLARVGEGADALLRVLQATSDEDVQGPVCLALGLLRARAALAPLQALVATSRFRPLRLREAAVGLALIGDKSAVTTLVEQLRGSGSLASASACCAALGTIGDVRALDALISVVSDRQQTQLARAFAAAALGVICDKDDLPFNTRLARMANLAVAPETLIDPTGATGILDLF